MQGFVGLVSSTFHERGAILLSQIRESEQAIRSFHSSQLIRNKYENILENLDSGIILFDSDGVLAFVNVQMAKLLGVSVNR